ncbi:MAG: hypothetical protein SFZ03_03710 [Candidatus Melainabacteria bacterium]|nr:hypothetical protein [Candidatus Melainabacteria bacterium]
MIKVPLRPVFPPIRPHFCGTVAAVPNQMATDTQTFLTEWMQTQLNPAAKVDGRDYATLDGLQYRVVFEADTLAGETQQTPYLQARLYTGPQQDDCQFIRQEAGRSKPNLFKADESLPEFTHRVLQQAQRQANPMFWRSVLDSLAQAGQLFSPPRG